MCKVFFSWPQIEKFDVDLRDVYKTVHKKNIGAEKHFFRRSWIFITLYFFKFDCALELYHK